jgi:hypothetical protein
MTHDPTLWPNGVPVLGIPDEMQSDAQAAPARAPRANLRDAAAAVLAAWDDEANLEGPMEALRALLATKPARAARDPNAPRKPREGTKQEAVISLLRREEGATLAQICEATGWQAETARGFLARLRSQGMALNVVERIRMVGPNKRGAKGSYSVYRLSA